MSADRLKGEVTCQVEVRMSAYLDEGLPAEGWEMW